jgi:methyl-accepting chemotaxis protein
MTMVALAVAMMAFVTYLAIAQLGASLTDQRSAAVQMQVESAMSIAGDYAARAASGEMTLEEAQAAAKATIGAIRYGDNDYFFVVDESRMGLVHPNPDIIGRDLSNVVDQNDVLLFRELVSRAQEGGGFTPYVWPRAGSDIPLEKISYSMLFDAWGWVIATGVYVDDLQALVRSEALSLLFWNVALLSVLVVVSVFVARSISTPVTNLREAIAIIEAGNLDKEITPTSSDELADISRNLDTLRRSLKAKAAVEDEAAMQAAETARIVEVVGANLRKLSDGNWDAHIEEQFPEDYKSLRLDFNNAVNNLSRLYKALEDSANVV